MAVLLFLGFDEATLVGDANDLLLPAPDTRVFRYACATTSEPRGAQKRAASSHAPQSAFGPGRKDIIKVAIRGTAACVGLLRTFRFTGLQMNGS